MPDEDNNQQLSLGFGHPTEEPETSRGTAEDAGEVLEWVCHPAKRNRLLTAAVSLLIVVIVIVVYAMTYSVLFTILAFLIMTGSLAAFFFPTRYTLTEKEIFVKTATQNLHKKWSQYRTYYPDRNGILLSPFARPSRLENFRGLYIRFWNNRDDVVAYVKKMIEKGGTMTDGEN
ncbi:MAG: hypothetical protein JSV44_03455 [Candidatus Zixiibacteriota bacterium]|nr:MAG: hypothetical protein JSV44_03455 [candidate division Zixibacteria bacterium]